jgi:hypothetical protein
MVQEIEYFTSIHEAMGSVPTAEITTTKRFGNHDF